tara:strand:- start:1991 stop:2203 length:213 start_codon:yes stop_codon:yes gene_type:complete
MNLHREIAMDIVSRRRVYSIGRLEVAVWPNRIDWELGYDRWGISRQVWLGPVSLELFDKSESIWAEGSLK